MSVIVGLSGYGGSGKDTVADYLVGRYGFVRRAFADPMRESLYRLNPLVPGPGMHDERLRWLVDTFGWDQAKRQFPEIRRLLQTLGTECGRDLHGPNLWIDHLFAHLPAGNVVITDVRYPNEARHIASRHGRIWRISRPRIGPINEHPSDSALDGWPFTDHLHNNHTIDHLHRQIDRLLHPTNTPTTD